MCISRVHSNNQNIELIKNSKSETIKTKNSNIEQKKSEIPNSINPKDHNNVKVAKGSSAKNHSFVGTDKPNQNVKLHKGDTWENGKVISLDVKGTTYRPADKKI